MDMSPNQVRTATFTTVRKGWDPAEVAAFLERAADALEQAQNHATAMEARARAAVAKLQDLTSADSTPSRSTAAAEASTPAAPTPAPPAPVSPAPPTPTEDEREIISRTLLLAQRAADEAVSEGRAEARRLVDEAREAARREGADERQRIRDEVDALSARRGFLQSDVEHLENFLLDQRERLRSAAASLVDMAEKVPGGLGYLRPPLLSAGDEPVAGPAPSPTELPAAVEGDLVADDEPVEVVAPAADEPAAAVAADDEPEAGEPTLAILVDVADDPTPPGLPQDPDAR